MSALQMNATAISMPVVEAALPPRVAAPPLPVLATVLRAYTDVITNRSVVFRLFGAWTVVLAVACLGTFLAIGLLIQNAAVELLVQPGAAAGPASALSVGVALVCVTIVLATCSIVVGWLRFLLAGERPSLIYLSLGATVWRYIWGTVVLFLLLCLAVVPVAFAMLPLIAASGSANFGQLGNALMTLFTTVAAARLMVAMPAVALGRPRAFRDAWKKTTGNTARIALSTILAMLPWQLVVQIWSLMVPAGTTVSMTPVVIAFFAAGSIAWSVAILASVGVAATAYRHFVEPGASADQATGSLAGSTPT